MENLVGIGVESGEVSLGFGGHCLVMVGVAGHFVVVVEVVEC